MTHGSYNPVGSWPRLMRAETAARYVDERSVRAFRRSVGTLYPIPVKVKGKGARWLRDDLDQALARLKGQPSQIFDAASVLCCAGSSEISTGPVT